jgi:signal transduction histidine kinase
VRRMDWPRFARAADAAVVAVLAVWGQLTVWTADTGPLADDRPVHALLVAVATVPLFVRRRRPLLGVLLVLGAGWLHHELGGGSGVLWFGLCLAMYALGAHADRWSVVAGSVVVAGAILPVDIPRLLDGAAFDEVVPAWVILAALVGLGRWMRHRRSETEQLQARAGLSEREVAEQAARAVSEERARIARELHDLVAHSMGVIVIQSQAAQRAMAERPDLTRSALASIETAGRQGMAEMRRLLGLLTGGDDGTVAPQPSLDDLDELVGRVRAAGIPVELSVAGDVASLPAGVDLAAYRIVQEALTNVLKHAGATSAQVVVRVGCGVVDVEVCDDGRGNGKDVGAGHGLVGMRERVALYGGTVEAGGRPDGGYRVRARLAIDGTPT